MLILFLEVCLGALTLLAIVAAVRARRASSYHDISAAEIHPDLAAGEELLQDAIAENQCRDTKRVQS
jgi:hypothetical protein